MSHVEDVTDPALAAMLADVAGDPIDAMEPAPEQPAEAAALASPERESMSPAAQDAIDKRAALVAASEAVLLSVEGEAGLYSMVDGMNRTLDGARLILGSVFSLPKYTVDRFKGAEIMEASSELYKAMRTGEAFKLDPFISMDAQVQAMGAAFAAWGKARQKVMNEGTVSTARAAKEQGERERLICDSVTLPDQYLRAREAARELNAATLQLSAELTSMGDFAAAYERALDGDWSAVETWQRTHQAKLERALAASAKKSALPVENTEPQVPPATPETDTTVHGTRAGDDEILAPIPLEQMRPPVSKAVAGPLDQATDAPPPARTLDEAEAAFAQAEAMPDDDAVAKSLALSEAAEAMSNAADALPDDADDQDPMDALFREDPLPRVTHASDPLAPRDAQSPFDPMAFLHKHFYALAGGAAVLVLGAAFFIGHLHRAEPAPLPVPVAAPAPAPVVQVPPVVPAPASSAPAVRPAPSPVKPAVVKAAPATLPAPAPTVRKPSRPVEHEHVTTMHETNQALDQLRQKLGE